MIIPAILPRVTTVTKTPSNGHKSPGSHRQRLKTFFWGQKSGLDHRKSSVSGVSFSLDSKYDRWAGLGGAGAGGRLGWAGRWVLFKDYCKSLSFAEVITSLTYYVLFYSLQFISSYRICPFLWAFPSSGVCCSSLLVLGKIQKGELRQRLLPFKLEPMLCQMTWLTAVMQMNFGYQQRWG